MCIIWVCSRAEGSLGEIVVVDGLSINVPWGIGGGGGGLLHQQTPNRQMQTPTHMRTHMYTELFSTEAD